MSEKRTEFEEVVLAKLGKLENAAEPKDGKYFTVNQAFGALVAALVISGGFAAWLINQVDKKIDAQTAALERQIDLIVTNGLEQLEASLSPEFGKNGWVGTSIMGAMDVYPVQFADGDKVFWAKDTDGKFRSLIEAAISQAVESGDVRIYDG